MELKRFKIKKFFLLIKVSPKLGFISILKVLIYRLGIKSGFLKLISPIEICPIPELFIKDKNYHKIYTVNQNLINKCIYSADIYLEGKACFFFKDNYEICSPPNWFFDYINKTYFQNNKVHWSECNAFTGSDIKNGWELSRWKWSTTLARAWRLTGNKKYLDILETWTKSWCMENPCNSGINWFCGQEISIRLIHAIQTWQILDYPINIPETSSKRISFVLAHLKRINQTLFYAEGQKNNHWISEASAMFIASNWLLKGNKLDKKNLLLLKKYASCSKKSLENSIQELFLIDGSFSQQSCNYHRFVLDTLIQVEFWRKSFSLDPFSENFYKKIFSGLSWLKTMVDPISGEAPNLGSNDGTYCYQLHDEYYNDFRPTLALGYSIFKGEFLSYSHELIEAFFWLKVPKILKKETISENKIEVFQDGGYAFLRPNKLSWSLLRIPKNKFRPSQCDPLHIDLWHNGKNVLRDAGTFSYNSSLLEMNYFNSIKAHNCVQFDGQDPMPKISRFLWGNWLNNFSEIFIREDNSKLGISADYKISNGYHKRTIQYIYKDDLWRIIDKVSLFKKSATFIWRLYPINWQLIKTKLISEIGTINFITKNKINSISLEKGWESKYYSHKNIVPCLEICFLSEPINLVTEIKLNNKF